jgi:uracil-DNA glycosylase family 4
MSEEIQRISLAELHLRINNCTVCSAKVPDLAKPSRMKRGDIAPIIIVGMAPGNTEIEKEEAFSGPSGKRLNEWLIQSGADPENPRKLVYLTSVVKCAAPEEYFPILARNCRHFMNKQVELIRPRLIISLGTKAYNELRFTSASFNEAVCNVFHSKENVLTTQVGFHYSLLPWPHPSGLSRWHNDSVNLKKLSESFSVLKAYIRNL